jgi:prevent-host-death family protein
MEVAVSALRAELKTWIEAARAGEDVIITDRGVPVARLSGIGAADLVQSLVRDGLLTPAQEPRPGHEPPAAGPGPRGGMSGLVRRIRR